jgi:hypothetical protein
MFNVSGSSIFSGEIALLSAVVTRSGLMNITCGFNFLDINLEIWSRSTALAVLPSSVCGAKSLV